MNKWIWIAVAVIIVVIAYFYFSGGGSDEAMEAEPAATSEGAAEGTGSN